MISLEQGIIEKRSVVNNCVYNESEYLLQASKNFMLDDGVASFSLRLFGHPVIELDGHPIYLETRKALAILIYLALSPQPVAREYLATLFWPEFCQTQALANLRRNLSSLMAGLKMKVLEVDRQTVYLKGPSVLYIDVQDFRQKINEVQNHLHVNLDSCAECQLTLEEGIKVYQEEFIQGFNLWDCSEFNDWQLHQRQALQQELHQALEEHIRQCVVKHEWGKGILSAQRLLALDCLDETSRRKLMWLYGQDNQRIAALHQYEELVQALRIQLGQAPEPETIELYQNLRDGNPIQCNGLDELLMISPGSKPVVALPQHTQSRDQLVDNTLKTKLFIPPARKDAVNRPRLIKQINQGVQGVLTLVSAPAGFGKTTLLANWAAQSSAPIGWLTLDADDNEPVRFLTYLIMALKSIRPGTGEASLEMIASPQPPPPQTILIPLINEISRLGTRFVLVLDDYHILTSEQIQKVIAFLIDQVCPNLHLIIATRSDPLLPLSRLRARNQLVCLRAEDLRFSTAEAEDFLNSVMGLDLSTEDVAVIGKRTEGWVAGLQMAALSMSGREDKSDFIQAFSGSHRYILDYLVDEVLSQQSETIQTFLLETSVLERLSGLLCDALTGNNNGRAMLELLERLNLFLIPLDDEHHWYRYHQLFAGSLRGRLQFSKPDLFTTMHERASGWFENNGSLNDSIYHALEAKDTLRSANLVEKLIRNKLNFNGAEIIAWIDQIPEELVSERAFLCLARAVDNNNKFHQDTAIRWLQAAEDHALTGYAPEESNVILGLVDTIRAVIATIRGDLQVAIEKASSASQRLANRFLRFDALGILGETLYLSGDIQKALEQWDEIEYISRTALNTYGVIEAMDSKVRALCQLGRLREAEHVIHSSFRLAAEKGVQKSTLALARLWYGDLLREWNELGQAEDQVSAGLAFFSEEVRPDNLCIGYIFQASISLARGNLPQASEACQKAGHICSQVAIYPDIVVMAKLCKIRLLLAEGNLPEAEKVLRECQAGQISRSDLLNEWILIAKARLQINRGQLKEASDALATLAERAQSASRNRNWLEIMSLQAIAHHLLGQNRSAFDVLSRSLPAALPEGYIQLFVSEGETMRSLLQHFSSEISTGKIQVENRDRLTGYVNNLLGAFSLIRQQKENDTILSQLTLVEPLTSRELEVLRLLCKGLSNPEIAEKLFIANSTVKSHIHHIFGKFGVSNRPQAIVRANELNLV